MSAARCPDCALLETRVCELERAVQGLKAPCAVCREASVVACVRCARLLCVPCYHLPTCAHAGDGKHQVFP